MGKRLFTRIGNMFVLLRNKNSKNAMFVFKEKSVAMAHANLIYPRGYRHKGQQQLDILPTGYVAPTTVTLTNGSAYIKIIFSFGGGEYRVEKS
ncbi:type II secretion protein [Leuconostoc citreum]|uniref:type II secretion protein n=1 Tax=Leuconostoc citreum TaxID=33964 RepID=UPI003D7F692D